MRKPAPETVSFFVGTLSAIAASACCVLPPVLASFGVGSAWVSQLPAFERFFPVFAGISAAAFAFGFNRIYLRAAPGAPDSQCATPQPPRRQRVAFWVAVVLAAALIALPLVRRFSE